MSLQNHPIDRRAEFLSNAAWVTRVKMELSFALFLLLGIGYLSGMLQFPLSIIGICVLLEASINLPHGWLMQRVGRPVWIFAVTSCADIIILTIGAYALGDLGKVLVLLIYPTVAIFAGVVMHPKSTLVYSNLAFFAMAALMALEHFGILPRVSPLYAELSGEDRLGVMLILFVIYNFLAYFVCHLSMSYRNREKQLIQSVFYDQLTGLPTRDLFMERLRQTIVQSQGASGRLRKHARFSVLLIDLDRFKTIINSYGQTVGGTLLYQTARKLETCVKTSDTVAYFGGDQFAILLQSHRSSQVPVRVSERIQEALSLPFEIQGQEIFTSASIGIAMGARGHSSPEEILRDAHTALTSAKASGRGRHEIFDVRTRPQVVARLELENQLRRAMQHHEFELNFQPIFQLDNNRLIDFEVLIRWPQKRGGFIAPAEFIPLAEETGLVVDIDRWVFREACQQWRAWQKELQDAPLPSLSVNTSPEGLKQRRFPDFILQALNETGMPANQMKLEITENVLIEDAENALQDIARLNSFGVEFYIDDFGTGYSSLAYLRRFNMAKLKIDRSFIRRISSTPKDLEIVKNIIVLAHDLNISVIAEGVETPQQAQLLKQLGCDYVQGYYFSKPLSAEAALMLIRNQRLDNPA